MPRPTVVLKLDDGTGTYPYDVSNYLRLTDGIQRVYGRQDEQGAVTAGMLTCTLDNSDGRFTLGSGTYGIALNQKVRLTVNSVNRFTGYVQNWPVRWMPAGKQALATITAVDGWGRLSRMVLGSQLEEQIRALSPLAYYKCDEPVGAPKAIDSSDNAYPDLYANSGLGTLAFGAALDASTLSATGVRIVGSKGLGLRTPDKITLTAAISLAITFRADVVDNVFLMNVTTPAIAATYISLGIGGSAGEITAVIAGTTLTSGVIVAPGEVHQAVFTISASGSQLFVDGALKDSDTGTSMSGSNIPFNLVSSSTTCDITVAHGAIFDAVLTNAQVADLWEAVDNGDSSDDRIGKIAGYAGQPTGTIDTGRFTLDFPDMTGMTAADALNEIGAAENGLVFIDGTGNLRFQAGDVRAENVAADFTADTATEIVGADVEVISDMTDVVNYATGKRVGATGIPQLSKDDTSVTQHGRYPQEVTTWVSSDDDAHDRSNWLVAKHKQPAPRIPSFALDLLTAASATSALALELGDRVALSNMPSQTPAGIGDQMIEGWTETISTSEWTLRLNTTSWALQTAWILNDTTYSVLNTTTLLGI